MEGRVKSGIHRDVAVGRKVEHKFMHYRHRHPQCGQNYRILSQDSLRGASLRFVHDVDEEYTIRVQELRQNSEVVIASF